MKLVVRQPTESNLEKFLEQAKEQSFSYKPQEITKGDPLRGYQVDRYDICLGTTTQVFEQAVEGVKNWVMFDLPWIRLFRRNTPIKTGETVAVAVNHRVFWSINACRIVYVIDEQDRFGFAYGTLTDHGERGEEKFLVERNGPEEQVWYRIVAMSRPGFLAGVAYPYSRRLQITFGRASKNAMLHYTKGR
ncbi:MAG: DUF1990 domain-containing protein [Verrucomicrobiota bacterium]